MNYLALKTIRCVIRTVGGLALIALAVWGIKYLELNYEDLKVVLALINAYFVELIWLATYGAMGFVLYRASVANNDFHFIHFFVTSPEHHEDLSKFAIFILLINCALILFTLTWRDKEIATVLGLILAAFVVKGGVEVAGKAWGKDRQAGDQQPKGDG